MTSQFFEQYFIEPILRNGWFNPVNTLVYGIILVLATIVIYKLLKKLKIRIDERFFIAILPFIFFAGITRVLRDYFYFLGLQQPNFLGSLTQNITILQNLAYNHILNFIPIPIIAKVEAFIISWFATPGSYLFTFLIALVTLLISLAIEKYTKFAYWKTMFTIGFILCVFNYLLLPINSSLPLILISSVSIAFAGLFFLTTKLSLKFNLKRIKELFTPVNSGILSAHFFDATATFFALTTFVSLTGFGYLEQHFTSRLLMPFFSPAVLWLLKFIIILPILYLIDQYTEKGDFRNFLKIIIIILGLAPGIRDLVRLMVGV